jgi:malate/lactate dehydrogenase
MMVGMIANGMARLDDLAKNIRISDDIVSDTKKSGSGMV